MAGLFGRASIIIKSKFSRLLDRAENPAETLDYSYEEQLRQLQNVKRGIADVATAKKRLEMQYTSMQQQVEKLDGQAKQALTANREDLAREALTRKAAVQGQLEGIMQSGQQLEAQQTKLVESEKALASRGGSARPRPDLEPDVGCRARRRAREGQDAVDAGARRCDQRAKRGRHAHG